MRSSTLSWSVLKAHYLPSSPKPSKSRNAHFFSFNLFFKKHSSKFCLRNPSLIFSRDSGQWCENRSEEWLGHSLPKVLENQDVLEVRYTDCKTCSATGKSIPNLDLSYFLDYLHTKNSSRREYHIATDIISSCSSFGSIMKFMMLFGSLTLQGSQPAIAGTDFSSGLQSIPYIGDLGDIFTGFASAFLLIFFSELGDKTFFIAALLAARNSAATVFIGTFGALAAMTIISVILGRTFHYVDEILPFRFGETDLPIDDIAAVFLLVYFGVSTLLDASSSDGLKAEDEQKKAELAVSEFSGNGAGILAAANTIISTFLLVFVAEWGDKSFFSTIALAAASSPLGVIGGALAGHGVATLLAVLGGSLLGTFLSEKAIAYVGGALFLVFAAVTLVEIVN
ncbi:GDT1-like protein 1, chloroplastic isoform X2 [Mangifera indica]|uniref:GDT1-like protein 1, chloroplastic isoform X2 n=1 Tax=Mangifera indica TaxID=29780 RepID=UPI001CFB9187|nr:GDT1-like protein 1, chloroplastic isoform X2 [Mangifera indica]